MRNRSPQRLGLPGGLLVGFLVLVSHPAPAQKVPSPDSLRVGFDTVKSRIPSGPVDSLLAISDTTKAPPDTSRAKADTTAVAGNTSGIDSVVTYTATDSIVYSLSSKTMFLYGKGSIKHKAMGLKAEVIDVNWNSSVLNAAGVVDTADTSRDKIRGRPELIDAGENYKGTKLGYNFKTKKGKIDVGTTEIEKGYYRGEEIKKVSSDVLFVSDGRFTTCDAEHPHYYFASPTMKVVVKDKVVARPVYLYISDVPIFALPFGVFPSERGRRSGLIAPAYGESQRGRYLLHLGYYWAMNDYMDWSIRGDGYTKGSWVLSSNFRYALRYFFSGEISGSYAKTISGERGDPGYNNEKVFNLHFGHNQDFNPTTRLVVDFTFTSGSYLRNTSFNFNDLLQQNIVSNATLTKFWEGTPNSMTINIRRDQNISPDPPPGRQILNEVLPSISFNRSQTFPFRLSKSDGGGERPWFELIGYSYGGQFLNTRTKTKLDSANNQRTDERRGIQHSIQINASPKLGYFTVTPFFNYGEKWYDRSIRKFADVADSSIVTKEVKGFNRTSYYDMGVSLSTKLIGVVQPNVLGIKGIRHQISPGVSYTYQPDFSKASFGYYGTYRDFRSGQEVKYSFHEQELFGGAPSEERQSIGLRIGNVFEMKTASTDTSGQDNKFTLLNLDVGTSYNFVRDSLKFDEIGISYRTSIGQLLSIGGGASYNLYKFEPDRRDPRFGRRVNKFLINEDGRLAQLTSFNINLSTSLSGEKKKTSAGPVKSEADSLARRSGTRNVYDDAPPDFSIPWNLGLTWNFQQSQTDPRVKSRSSNVSVQLGFNLTEFWKITASTSYDILNKELAAPQLTIYRDLHCWEMNFTWVPTGFNRNFRLEIKLKAPQLQDVKVTKQESAREIF